MKVFSIANAAAMIEYRAEVSLWDEPNGTVIVIHDNEGIVVTAERNARGLWYATGNGLALSPVALARILQYAETVFIIERPEGWKA